MGDMTTSVEQCDDQRQDPRTRRPGQARYARHWKAITQFVERHEPGSRCAILLISPDPPHSTTCVAPSFSEAFCNSLSEICIDRLGLGSCGAAADATNSSWSAMWPTMFAIQRRGEIHFWRAARGRSPSHPIRDGEKAVALPFEFITANHSLIF